MTREIADPPHPTPNPDGPGTPARNHDETPLPGGSTPPPEDEFPDEEPYDSLYDDVNLKLSESIQQPAPDPALGPETSEGGTSTRSGPHDPLGQLTRDNKLSPRTSEVFKAVVGLSAGLSEPTPPGSEVPPAFLEGESPDPETGVAAEPGARFLPELVVDRQVVARTPTRDEDLAGEARFPWFQVLLLSYASAVTLALTWFVFTGRSFRPSDRAAASTISTADPGPSWKSSTPRLDGESLPPVPAENITTINSPLEIGNLRVTPLSVALARVELVGSIDPSKYRAEDSESLVMHLQLTNLSTTQRFAPLELAYIREQSSRLDRCVITCPDGATIGAFPLAVDSEWSIVGQESRVLEPGETMETKIASEPGAAARMGSEMMWRTRFRIGTFRTDIVGVRFRETEVQRDDTD